MDKGNNEGDEDLTEEAGAEGSDWRRFTRRHLGVIAVLAVACVLAFAGAVYVFWWFAGNAQSTGLVPGTLGLWTMGNLVNFILYTIFWELLLVGIPVAVGAVIGWLWWKRLPEEERKGHHFGGRSRSAGGGSGVSFLFFIAFCVKVFIDGKWNAPIATFTLDYVVGSIITILEWGLVIFGIPGAIALAWWIRRETKKP
jgi:fatty acid desaturase